MNDDKHLCNKEEIINYMREQINDFSKVNEAVIKLSTIMEMQEKRNEKIDNIVQEQSILLGKMTQTIESQNDSLEKLNSKIDSTDKKLEDLTNKVDEESKQNIKSGSISFNDLFKMAIPTLLVSGIAYFILNTLNLIK